MGRRGSDVVQNESMAGFSVEKADGSHVNGRDLEKYKDDVLRLFPLVEPTVQIAVNFGSQG